MTDEHLSASTRAARLETLVLQLTSSVQFIADRVATLEESKERRDCFLCVGGVYDGQTVHRSHIERAASYRGQYRMDDDGAARWVRS